MTMTESPPANDTASAGPAPVVAGLYDALTTTDHKSIGRLWLRAGMVLLVGAVVLGVLLGFERVDSESTDLFGGDNAFFQVWALYRLGLALLVAAPLFIGIATVVVPMQVGSTNIAFPRAAHAAVWAFIIGAGITIAAVLANGGWGAVDRVSNQEREAIALSIVGLAMVVLALLLASICIATTVVSMRVKGMTLLRVPLFAWSMLVATSVWILTLPVLLANMLVAYVDIHNGPGGFGGDLSGDLGAYAQIAWVVEQPQVYAFAIPVLGVLGSIVPVAAGVRAARHGLSMGLIGAFGLLSVGAWAQPFFQPTNDAVVRYDEKFVFIAFGLAAILPVLGALGGAADSLVRGRGVQGVPPAHLLGALGGGLLLLAGTAAGVARVIEPFELGDRVTVAGVMNLVLFAAVASAIGAIWFWSPKVCGHELSPVAGRGAVMLVVLGGLVVGASQVINGFFETTNNPLVAPTEDAGDVLNAVALVGMIVIALGAVGALATLLNAMRTGGAGTADDPWGGQTLEWSTVTPPPPGNFAEAPALVTSEAPLLDVSSDEGEES